MKKNSAVKFTVSCHVHVTMTTATCQPLTVSTARRPRAPCVKRGGSVQRCGGRQKVVTSQLYSSVAPPPNRIHTEKDGLKRKEKKSDMFKTHSIDNMHRVLSYIPTPTLPDLLFIYLFTCLHPFTTLIFMIRFEPVHCMLRRIHSEF